VSKNLGLEAELGDDLAVPPRLLRAGRTGQLDVVDTELVQGLAEGWALALAACNAEDGFFDIT